MAVLNYPQVSMALSDAPSNNSYQTCPAISWGASVNLTYQNNSGSGVSAGPFSTGVVRIAQPSGNVYVAIGSSSVNAIANLNPGTLVIGPEVEFVAVPNGWYVAAISFDTTTGTINLTSALTQPSITE